MRIIKDLLAFSKGSKKKMISTIVCNPCFHSVCLFRLSGFFCKIRLSPISKIVWYVNRILFHSDIDYRADLAGGFVLVHGLGTVIGADVKSTGRLTVYQNVTIGGSRDKTREIEGDKTMTQPQLADGVIVYAGAMVFGPVFINENVIIKAGTTVTSDM